MDNEPIAPLLFHDAVQLIPKNHLVLQVIKNDVSYKNVPFIGMLKSNIFQLLFLQPYMFLRLLILEQFTNSCKILFNGLFCKDANVNHPWQIWILNRQGALVKIETEHSLTSWPKLDRFKKRQYNEQQNLCVLLGLDCFESDPVDFNSTVAFLSKHNKLDFASIIYLFAYNAKTGGEMWNEPKLPAVYIEAFTTHKYQLGFRLKKFKVLKSKNKPVENDANKMPILEPSITQANRSSAVSVKLLGLNLAFDLACTSLEQLKKLSFELGKCAAAMWMEYDSSFNARYVTVSALNHFYQTEIIDETSWNKVFNLLFKIRDTVAQQKQKVLNPLLTHLNSVDQSVNSPYSTCVKQLTHTIQHLDVVLFSNDDTCIHAIKFQFATFLKEADKKCKSIYLNTNAKNTLTMLKTTQMTFTNLNIYFSQDAVFNSNLPTPVIYNHIKLLKNQPKTKLSTVLSLCKQRGKEIAPQLQSCFTTIGQFFINHFELDIFSLHLQSLSILAFIAVWSKYARIAGIFHQGLEKTKAAYEVIFRNFSRGGYSFSCKDVLDCGKPIFGNEGENASTLMGLDIISSYGYAGSQIQTPTGFCNAYFENPLGTLQLAEPFARHFSFEFLSVYYTLFLLSQSGLEIKTVYSNFHTSGLFYLKKYPIDLVVISVNGDIAMYQFDGSYAHGCREGCRLANSFVRGRQRHELEKETDKRDAVINLWVKETNERGKIKASYHVISECHSDNYKLKTLKSQFFSNPVLANIIKGYPTAKTLSKDDVLFSSSDQTFLIILQGFIPQSNSCNLPLMIKNDDQIWSRSSKTDQTPILLSKDYLCWLTTHFNFQVTKIHSVFFYKRCAVLNDIFSQLTLLRMDANVAGSVKQLVKNVINFSAGYFGLNQKKNAKKTCRLVSTLSGSNWLQKNVVQYLGTFLHTNYWIVSNFRKTKKPCNMSIAPIPIFVFIVEFGKKRLAEILCFFDKYLLPTKYRHLYSNVDNVLFALSTSSIDEAVNPQLKEKYHQDKQKFFDSSLAGHLKFELTFSPDQEWKFVSAMVMNYCIKTKDSDQTTYKCPYNNITGEQVFENSLLLLKKTKFEIVQERRVNKIANKDVKTITFQYNV
jgi:hypothetical protein